MEYCAGGSVYKMLEDPVNLYGLLEDEFLVFLRDISTSPFDSLLFFCDGVTYLRSLPHYTERV